MNCSPVSRLGGVLAAVLGVIASFMAVSAPPATAGSAPPDRLISDGAGNSFVQVASFATVHSRPDPRSELLGLVQDQSRLRVLSRQGEWCRIPFEGGRGWIHQSRLLPRLRPVPVVVTNVPAASPTLPVRNFRLRLPRLEWTPLYTVVLASSAAGLLVFVVVLQVLRRVRARAERPTRSMGRIRRAAIMYAEHDMLVRRSMSNIYVSASSILHQRGFDVSYVTHFDDLENAVMKDQPHLLVVDSREQERTIDSVARLLATWNHARETTVLFYNIPSIRTVVPTHLLMRAMYSGEEVTERDLAVVIESTTLSPAPTPFPAPEARHETHPAALEGIIEPGEMIDLFQYLELSRKTGCLTVETDGPFGTVHLRNGKIVHAATGKAESKDAALSVLRLGQGYFKFTPDARGPREHCLLSPTHLAMMWAQDSDERGIVRLAPVRAY